MGLPYAHNFGTEKVNQTHTLYTICSHLHAPECNWSYLPEY